MNSNRPQREAVDGEVVQRTLDEIRRADVEFVPEPPPWLLEAFHELHEHGRAMRRLIDLMTTEGE